MPIVEGVLAVVPVAEPVPCEVLGAHVTVCAAAFAAEVGVAGVGTVEAGGATDGRGAARVEVGVVGAVAGALRADAGVARADAPAVGAVTLEGAFAVDGAFAFLLGDFFPAGEGGAFDFADTLRVVVVPPCGGLDGWPLPEGA